MPDDTITRWTISHFRRWTSTYRAEHVQCFKVPAMLEVRVGQFAFAGRKLTKGRRSASIRPVSDTGELHVCPLLLRLAMSSRCAASHTGHASWDLRMQLHPLRPSTLIPQFRVAWMIQKGETYLARLHPALNPNPRSIPVARGSFHHRLGDGWQLLGPSIYSSVA